MSTTEIISDTSGQKWLILSIEHWDDYCWHFLATCISLTSSRNIYCLFFLWRFCNVAITYHYGNYCGSHWNKFNFHSRRRRVCILIGSIFVVFGGWNCCVVVLYNIVDLLCLYRQEMRQEKGKTTTTAVQFKLGMIPVRETCELNVAGYYRHFLVYCNCWLDVLRKRRTRNRIWMFLWKL